MKKNPVSKSKTAPEKGKQKVDKAAAPTRMNKSFHVALPLEKVIEGENGELYVEGFLARVDLPDKTPGMPEQMDEALSTPHFLKWVEDTKQRSQGKSLFNAREMHSNKAAGRGVEFKHVEGVGYWGRSEVVDTDTKEKVRKGVITSHSVGGHYGETRIDNGILHYEAEPIEVSYVDVPMIPGTEFQFQHANGEIEMRKFENVQPVQLTPKEFIAKYAALKKEEGYAVDPDYARSESWDIATAARVIGEATQLMLSEANEPEDAKEVASIIRAVLAFMEGETNEMESAATGENPVAEGLQCAQCGAELVEAMKFCPMCGAAVTQTTESESETTTETEEPETEAENAGEEEAAGESAEEESESESESEVLDEEKVKKMIRTVFAELREAEKAEHIGELTKVMNPLAGQFEKLEKAQKALSGNVDRVAKDLTGDIAQVITAHNQLEKSVGLLQQTVDAYGPVVRVTPNVNTISNNVQGVTEKDVIKTILQNPQINPMLKQAYQSRLTELEILEAKPLEEPPTFVG